MVAAGAVVLQDARIPSGQLWAGTPAKFLRNLTPQESEFIPKSADNYAKLAVEHAVENGKTFEEIVEDKEARLAWAEYDEDQDSAMGIIRDKPPKPAPVTL